MNLYTNSDLWVMMDLYKQLLWCSLVSSVEFVWNQILLHKIPRVIFQYHAILSTEKRNQG